MIEIYKQMVTTQEALNKVAIGPNWRDVAPNFTLAMQQECAEGIDHLGWKWWAKQPVDLQKAQMELIDIHHFALSELMLKNGNTSVPAALVNAAETAFTTPVRVCSRVYALKDLRPLALFQITGVLAGLGYVDMRLIMALAHTLELSPEGFARLYFSKAILNTFRQERGYKEGTYIKMWAEGKEDNEFLQAEASKLDFSKPDTPRKLRNFLELTYKEITTKKPA